MIYLIIDKHKITDWMIDETWIIDPFMGMFEITSSWEEICEPRYNGGTVEQH